MENDYDKKIPNYALLNSWENSNEKYNRFFYFIDPAYC